MSLKKIASLGLVLLFTLSFIGCQLSTSSSTTTTTDGTTNTSKITVNNDRIEVINITKTEYNLNSSFDPSSLTVVLVKSSGSTIVIGSSSYEVSGFDSSTPGEQVITVTYRGMTATYTVTILESTTNLEITMAYYKSAQGLTGDALLEELRSIINTGFNGHNYTFASTALSTTDKDPNNSKNVILVYSGASVSGTWDSGKTWNKEHVWPQSLLGVSAGSSVNMASDLHNLKPSNPTLNSNRGNKYYDLTTTGATFTPREEVRGDIARILFYMMTMYDVLELVNGTPSVHQMGKLDVLLQWAEDDPVDDFERARNEAIFGFQNNRNPYIDYPDFVNYVFDYIS